MSLLAEVRPTPATARMLREVLAEPACPGLQVVNPLEERGWDDALLSHPEHSFFHSRAWAAVLHETYGFEPHYLVAKSGKQLLGLLPVMEVRPWPGSPRGVSLPFTDECAPLVSESVPCRALLAQATNLGQSRGWRYLECRGVSNSSEAPASRSYYRHVLDLSGGEDRVHEHLKPTFRTAIRKAEQAGVRVEASRSWEALSVFYSLHCQTRRRHGLPPQPLRFFRNIHRHLLCGNQGIVMVARSQGRPVAAAVFFRLGKRAIYKFGASDDALQELRANNLVMWNAIQWLTRSGCESLHFGRTDTTAEGLRRFKLGLGAREETVRYIKYDYRTSAFIIDPVAVEGWQQAVMRRMPVLALRLLGEMLYQYTA